MHTPTRPRATQAWATHVRSLRLVHTPGLPPPALPWPSDAGGDDALHAWVASVVLDDEPGSMAMGVEGGFDSDDDGHVLLLEVGALQDAVDAAGLQLALWHVPGAGGGGEAAAGAAGAAPGAAPEGAGAPEAAAGGGAGGGGAAEAAGGGGAGAAAVAAEAAQGAEAGLVGAVQLPRLPELCGRLARLTALHLHHITVRAADLHAAAARCPHVEHITYTVGGCTQVGPCPS